MLQWTCIQDDDTEVNESEGFNLDWESGGVKKFTLSGDGKSFEINIESGEALVDGVPVVTGEGGSNLVFFKRNKVVIRQADSSELSRTMFYFAGFKNGNDFTLLKIDSSDLSYEIVNDK
jgi:hypothetical protein